MTRYRMIKRTGDMCLGRTWLCRQCWALRIRYRVWKITE